MHLCLREGAGREGMGKGKGWDGTGTTRTKKGTAIMTAPDGVPYLAG